MLASDIRGFCDIFARIEAGGVTRLRFDFEIDAAGIAGSALTGSRTLAHRIILFFEGYDLILRPVVFSEQGPRKKGGR